MKKRVLHLLASNNYSGAENVACTIIDNCDDKYDMYYCSLDGPIRKNLKDRNINFIPLKRVSPFLINKICKKYNIDIIHAHDYKASFCAAISGFKGKIISQLHVNWEFNSSWNIYTFVYSMIMRRFSKIVVVSKEIVDDAIYAKKDINRFEIITNVVDKERVLVKSREFNTKKYDLIFVGRLSDVKRPEMVIEITNRLKEKFPKIKTCIIGKGELEVKCVDMICEYGLEENVDMIGFVDNPFPYVKNSKIGLLPSLHEGLPMSVIECMILGVPVLNGGVDGLKTLFSDYPEFICNNVDEYCEMIQLILCKKKNLNKYCSKIIDDATNMDKYIKKIEKLYK